MSSFAELFKNELEKTPITKADLSRKLGLKRQNYITNILAGRSVPSPTRIKEIGEILNIPPSKIKRLILVAGEERVPQKLKDYFSPNYTLNPVYKASTTKRIFNPTESTTVSGEENKDFTEAVLFEFDRNFFGNLFPKMKRIFISFYNLKKDGTDDFSKFTPGDLLFFDLGDGPDEKRFLYGELAKKTKSSFMLKGRKPPILIDDMVKIGKTLGGLF